MVTTAGEPGLSSRPLIIWWVKDGKVGHEKQCLGLLHALQKQRACSVYEFKSVPLLYSLLWLILHRFPPGTDKPGPDLIIGAGHDTHFPLVAAKRAFNGKTIVLMKPSLPTGFFDLCVVPKHDKANAANNLIETDGALNTQSGTTEKRNKTGLILIGGPSKHYQWDSLHCRQQIENIVKKESQINWIITDSRRTPAETSSALNQLDYPNLSYQSFKDCQSNWLDETLANTEYAWVSEDSASMIYEALSAGCKTGVIEGKPKKANKISDSIASLTTRKMVIGFADWEKGVPLTLPGEMLHEADRIANIIISRFFNDE